MSTNDAPGQVSQTTARLISLLRSRDATGRLKYGQTLDRPDLSLEDWLQHMTEEMLDAAGYAQAALRAARGGSMLAFQSSDDVLTIHGIRYHAGVFATFARAPIGTTFQIVARDDGVLTIRTDPLGDETPVPRITLTLAQIIDLAEFAGLSVTRTDELPEDDSEYHVYDCPPDGVHNEGEPSDPAGSRSHYQYIVLSGEYPEEGCIGLGPEIIPTGGHSPPVIAS